MSAAGGGDAYAVCYLGHLGKPLELVKWCRGPGRSGWVGVGWLEESRGERARVSDVSGMRAPRRRSTRRRRRRADSDRLLRVRIVIAASAMAIWISVIACAQRWWTCIAAALRSLGLLARFLEFFAATMISSFSFL